MQLSAMFDHAGEQGRPLVSFEVFPPKAESALEKLYENLDAFARLRPAFVSVTYGAGGSTRGFTIQVASRIARRGAVGALAHLTTVGNTRQQIHEVLAQMQGSGIKNILALRGDPPQGSGLFQSTPGGFGYANDLVAYIGEQFPGQFGVAVAGYPEGHVECESLEKDLFHLAQKVKAGAHAIITQLFFDNRVFFDFVRRCREAGITVPISAGVMPVSNPKQIKRMTEMCGATFPPAFEKALENSTTAEEAERVGTDWAVGQIRELLAEGVEGIHLYTMNRPRQTAEVMANAGLLALTGGE